MKKVEAVILCGGRGQRMGNYMQEYKCKSLIPILEVACLSYVLKALKYIKCPMCILSIDRDDIYEDIEKIAIHSDVPFLIIKDSGQGPTSVAIEASKYVSSSHFLMLHGHQIIFPDQLTEMTKQNHDFIASLYKSSSEEIRKVAMIDSLGYCINLRHGSIENPARDSEFYLDKPYLLKTDVIRNSLLSDLNGNSKSPVNADIHSHTIVRYMQNLYTIPANFRHEFHYEHEISDIIQEAKIFQQKYFRESK